MAQPVKMTQTTSMESALSKLMSKAATASPVDNSRKSDGDAVGEAQAFEKMISNAFLKAAEEEKRNREADKKATFDCLNAIVDKYISLQLTKLKCYDDLAYQINSPFPKYNGTCKEFEDWKQEVIVWFKMNQWTDEKRMVDVLSSGLSGQALIAYGMLKMDQKENITMAFAALKQQLDPESKLRNRNQFLRARRAPDETMRAFIDRCNIHVMRADEIDNASKSQWATVFMVEKVYTNLNPLDRKVLKAKMGKSQDVDALCKKADEILAMGDDVVAAFVYSHHQGRWEAAELQ